MAKTVAAFAGGPAVGKTSLLKTIYLFVLWFLLEKLGYSERDAYSRVNLFIEDVKISEPSLPAKILFETSLSVYIPSMRPDMLESKDVLGELIFMVSPGFRKKQENIKRKAIETIVKADYVFLVLDYSRLTSTLNEAISLLELAKSYIPIENMRRKKFYILVNKADKATESEKSPPTISKEAINEIRDKFHYYFSAYVSEEYPLNKIFRGIFLTSAYVDETRKKPWARSLIKGALESIFQGEILSYLHSDLRNNFVRYLDEWLSYLKFEF